MSEAPQIIVQGGTQGMRAWVRNIAAMALAADPNRTHQAVKVMGSETARIRYLGQGRCVIRITGDEARQGIAFQLLHDQQLQPQWYTVVYDAEDREFKVRKTAPPQHDSTWYGTRETDDGTVVERKVHWFSRPAKPTQRARLLGAGGPKALADNERILAAAPGADGKANLLICRGEAGQASQVLARWWASNSGDWQDTPVMDVPAYSIFGGEPQRLILASSFSPDGLKVTVGAQRAGCWDVIFRDGTAPQLKRLLDADVLPGELLSFVGGQDLQFQTRADIGVPEYFGYWPGDYNSVGYQGEACWAAVPAPDNQVFTGHAVKRRALRRRIEIDTMDLQRTNEAPNAIMWVKRETDAEDHFHELAQPAVSIRDGSVSGDCDQGDGPFKEIKVYVPEGYLVWGGANGTPHGIGDRRVFELFGTLQWGYALDINSHPDEMWAPKGMRVNRLIQDPPVYGEPLEELDFRGQKIPRVSLFSGVSVRYEGDFVEDGVVTRVFAEYSFLHPNRIDFFYGASRYTFWSYTFLPPVNPGGTPRIKLIDKFVTPELPYFEMRPLQGGGPDPLDPGRPAPSFTEDILKFVDLDQYHTVVDHLGFDVFAVFPTRLCLVNSADLGMLAFKQPLEREPRPGYLVSGYNSMPDYPWAQLEQTCSVSTSHFEVESKTAKLIKQQTLATTTTIVTSGADPYTSATRTIARSTTQGAATSPDARAMLAMPVVASAAARARLIDSMTGIPVGEAFNGFNSPGLADFSITHAGDQDLVFPGFWLDPQASYKYGNNYLKFPMQDQLLLREIWVFGKKVDEIRIGEKPAGEATALLPFAAFDVVPSIPVGTGRDQNGSAARIADYGLQHVGYTFGHGGGQGWSTGYTGDYFGSSSQIVLGYGGALGMRTTDFVATNPFNSHAPPWEGLRLVASAQGVDDAPMLSWTHNYGGSAPWESFEGRVCDVAYSPEAQITVVTARGTAHVAHRMDDGTVVHANLLQLLGKANAQGYSRDWWVVNLVEL